MRYPFRRTLCFVALAVVGVVALGTGAASLALAQQPTSSPTRAPTMTDTGDQGYSRIQRLIPDAPIKEQSLLDFREEMRNFIISIARFGRQTRSDFKIIARGGLELLVKRDTVDEDRTSPARTYIRALDGLIAEGMFFTERRAGTPPPPERQARMLELVDLAKRNGARIFTLDYGNGKKFIDQAHAQAQKRGFISLVIDQPLNDIVSLPTYPKRPFGENPKSVLTLNQVKNFIAVTNSQPFGRQDAFALAVHGTNYDMVIVDVFHGRRPLTRQAVETLKYKKIGAKRLVMARMDVGSAASHKYYWKDNWGEGSPAFLNMPYRDDPDRYHVEYWKPEWKRLMAGDTNAYLYGIIRQGFDGVVVDGLDAYKFFEADGEEQEEQ